MNSYSLVIVISSDEENAKTSTPLKTLPLNMIGSLSDSSIEVYRGSDAELVSTSESPPKRHRRLGRNERQGESRSIYQQLTLTRTTTKSQTPRNAYLPQ